MEQLEVPVSPWDTRLSRATTIGKKSAPAKPFSDADPQTLQAAVLITLRSRYFDDFP
jgi:hypothetical protein